MISSPSGATPSSRSASWRIALASAAVVAMTVAGAAQTWAAGGGFKKFYDAGTSAYAAGDFIRAVENFEKAFKIRPLPVCLFNIGQSHRKLGNASEALNAYERFLATGPDAELRAETEGYIAELRKTKEAGTEAAAAKLAADSGDHLGAAVRYEKAHATHPDPAYLYAAAESYEAAGNPARAIDTFEKYLAAGDEDAERKAAAEKRLAEIRSSLDADGTGETTSMVDGTDTGGGTTSMSGGTGEAGVSMAVTPVKKKKKTGLFIGIGVGAAVLVGGGVALAVILATRGPDFPDTTLDGITVFY